MTGSDVEREFATWAWEHGFASLRAPGSGSIDRPSPDVFLASTDVRYAIELKKAKDGTATFDQQEINDLAMWADRVDAKAYVGIKPDLRTHESWYFMWVYNLHRTPEDNFSIRKQDHDDCLSRSELFL